MDVAFISPLINAKCTGLQWHEVVDGFKWFSIMLIDVKSASPDTLLAEVKQHNSRDAIIVMGIVDVYFPNDVQRDTY